MPGDRVLHFPDELDAIERDGVAFVHPAKLAWGLARAAEELGVEIYEQTPAALGMTLNILGAKVSGRVNVVIVSAQILFYIALVVMISVYVVQGAGAGTLFVPETLYNAANLDSRNLLWAASFLATSFLGFDAVSTLAEETENPRTTLPRAVMGVCIGAGVGLAVIAYFLQIAWPDAHFEITDPDVGIFELLPRIGGDALSTVFLVTDQTATILAAMAAVAAVSRVLYGMGRDGMLPKRFFGKLSSRFGTSVNNIVLSSIIALTAIFYAENLIGATSLTSFGAITGFIMVNLSVIMHFFVKGRRRHGWDMVKYLVLPAIGIGVNIILWINIDGSAKLLGLGWLAIGIVYLAVLSRGFRQLPAGIRSEEELDTADEVPHGSDAGNEVRR